MCLVVFRRLEKTGWWGSGFQPIYGIPARVWRTMVGLGLFFNPALWGWLLAGRELDRLWPLPELAFCQAAIAVIIVFSELVPLLFSSTVQHPAPVHGEPCHAQYLVRVSVYACSVRLSASVILTALCSGKTRASKRTRLCTTGQFQ